MENGELGEEALEFKVGKEIAEAVGVEFVGAAELEIEIERHVADDGGQGFTEKCRVLVREEFVVNPASNFIQVGVNIFNSLILF